MEYTGFLLLASSQGDIEDLQIFQNSLLRICNKTRVSDRVSISELHKKCKIISLKQQMQKQLLWLMYILLIYACTFTILGQVKPIFH